MIQLFDDILNKFVSVYAMNSGLLCPRGSVLLLPPSPASPPPQAASLALALGGDGSQLFVLLKATECQIQHPNVKVPLYPFLLP